MTGQNISHRFRFAMSEEHGLQIEIPFGTRSPALHADIDQGWKTGAPPYPWQMMQEFFNCARRTGGNHGSYRFTIFPFNKNLGFPFLATRRHGPSSGRRPMLRQFQARQSGYPIVNRILAKDCFTAVCFGLQLCNIFKD